MGIVSFTKETKTELKHVAWPSKKQTVNATLLVIAISIGVALFLAFFDWIFSLGLKAII